MVTVTPTTPASRTAYYCGHTLAWAFTVDTTTTVSYSYTVWESTATATTTIVCPGVGGMDSPLAILLSFPHTLSPPFTHSIPLATYLGFFKSLTKKL